MTALAPPTLRSIPAPHKTSRPHCTSCWKETRCSSARRCCEYVSGSIPQWEIGISKWWSYVVIHEQESNTARAAKRVTDRDLLIEGILSVRQPDRDWGGVVRTCCIRSAGHASRTCQVGNSGALEKIGVTESRVLFLFHWSSRRPGLLPPRQCLGHTIEDKDHSGWMSKRRNFVKNCITGLFFVLPRVCASSAWSPIPSSLYFQITLPTW